MFCASCERVACAGVVGVDAAERGAFFFGAGVLGLVEDGALKRGGGGGAEQKGCDHRQRCEQQWK